MSYCHMSVSCFLVLKTLDTIEEDKINLLTSIIINTGIFHRLQNAQ
jgi:hypothetical protein